MIKRLRWDRHLQALSLLVLAACSTSPAKPELPSGVEVQSIGSCLDDREVLVRIHREFTEAGVWVLVHTYLLNRMTIVVEREDVQRGREILERMASEKEMAGKILLGVR